MILIYKHKHSFNLFDATIYADENSLYGIVLNDSQELKFDLPIMEGNNKIIQKSISQIEEYCEGKRKVFNLPVISVSKGFERIIYENLSKVEFGRTISYKELAEKSGNIKASRAVGNAMAKNKFPIVIPCHRVIKSNGEIGSYSPGQDLKKKLIEFEKKLVED